ncbi:MAG TPA: aminotransferase class IV family protein [Rudaea sp.]|nr:aminotransferase class IV family protein [Rudaea sp.]
MSLNHDIIELNGEPAQLEDLRLLAQTNYGHFTVMSVLDGRVRGLDLHLDRLQEGTRELFASELDLGQVRTYLRNALAGKSGAISVRITVFSLAFDRARPGAAAVPDVLIGVSRAVPSPTAPLRLKSFRYQRELAHIKHVGTFPLFHYRRLAQSCGFDDALFVDADTGVSEAAIWNIGFHDGDGVVWPDAPQLAGTGVRLLQSGLHRFGISQTTRHVRVDDLGGMSGVFVCNANTVARPVACIDNIGFPLCSDLIATLQRAYASNPWQTP